MNSLNPQHPFLFKLVVSHYLLSAGCFVAMAVMLLFSPEALTGHYFQPKLLAITHTAALGWGTLIIFGACYQLLPVILETELYSYKLGWISLALFFTGLLLLVCSFWRFDTGWCMQLGSLFLVSGIFLFAANTFITAKRAKKQNINQDYIITACVWLLATAVLGSLMVFNFQYLFLPKDHLDFLKLHAHMGIGGWFLLLIIGVSSKLIPMFLVSTKQKISYLNYSYYLINVALILFLIDTYVNGINTKTYLIALVGFAGIALWLLFIFHCFKSRMHKGIDVPMLHSFLSVLLLSASIIVLPIIIFYQLKTDPLAIRNTNLYGTLLFMGWITSLILGQTFKTLPFIVWVKHYQHLAGKGTIPMPASLYSKRLLKIQLLSFIAFIASFYAGLIFQSPILVKAGLLSFLLTTLLYSANVLIVISHKTRTINYARV